MNVFEKLKSVQDGLKAPKNQFNSFGKYHYRSCEDILEAVKPVCASVKGMIVINDDIVLIGDRFYVKATAKFIDLTDGASIEASAYAREENEKKGMDASQLTGATSSYARKYALNGLLQIDDSKDADTDNFSQQTQTPQKANGYNTNNNAPQYQKPVTAPQNAPQPMNQAQNNPYPWISEMVYAGCCRLGINIDQFAAYKKVQVQQLTDEMLKEAIKMKSERLYGNAGR